MWSPVQLVTIPKETARDVRHLNMMCDCHYKTRMVYVLNLKYITIIAPAYRHTETLLINVSWSAFLKSIFPVLFKITIKVMLLMGGTNWMVVIWHHYRSSEGHRPIILNTS